MFGRDGKWQRLARSPAYMTDARCTQSRAVPRERVPSFGLLSVTEMSLNEIDKDSRGNCHISRLVSRFVSLERYRYWTCLPGNTLHTWGLDTDKFRG